jgi:hypothetical protein
MDLMFAEDSLTRIQANEDHRNGTIAYKPNPNEFLGRWAGNPV